MPTPDPAAGPASGPVTDPAASGPLGDGVLVVGAGLLGTSLGLALRRHGVHVAIRDVDPDHRRTAVGLGAADSDPDELVPGLVVVAVPPDHLASAVVAALESTSARPDRGRSGAGTVVTDVGSVKSVPLAAVRERVGEQALARYVGSHPMAGSERSGPLAASASLFDGRPWAVVPHAGSDPRAVALVHTLAGLCGATPVELSAADHDDAVARTSHLPHLLAALVAGRLVGGGRAHLALSGQGVRDVTRVAAGDPGLWQQIVTANAGPLLALLEEVRGDLDRLRTALAGGDRGGLLDVLERGVAGTAAIPAKHGAPAAPQAPVYVAVPDHPGELARLFADTSDAGVNIEDLRIDHDPGRPVGLVELAVAVDSVDPLLVALGERGWTAHR